MVATHKIMFLESSPFTLVLCMAAVLVGLFAGGMAYTIAWRMAHNEPALGGSHCPECGHPLSLKETIPLVSWFVQRGTCNHCGAPVSVAYPACEMLGAGVFASIVFRYGISVQTLEILALAFDFMVIAITSLMDYSIRNTCIVSAVLIRFAYLGWLAISGQDFVGLLAASLVGACALGIPLALAVFVSNAMLARDVNGFGTIKLVGVVGLYLGWQQGMISLACALALAALVWLVSPTKVIPVEVEGGFDEQQDSQPLSPRDIKATLEEDICEPMRLIPMAPSIIISCWVMLLLGVALATWNSPIL